MINITAPFGRFARAGCTPPSGLKTAGLLLLCCILSVQTLGQSAKSRGPEAPEANPAVRPHRHDHESARGEEPSSNNPPEPGAAEKGPGTITLGRARIGIPDFIVLDQTGAKRRFYSDLIKDKTVVLSFFYTSCRNVCPAMALTLSKLQADVGERLGKEIFIVSVTKDPSTDRPRQLRVWGKRMGVKPGWTLVTGGGGEIGKIVRDLTGDALGQYSHNVLFLIGDDKTGNWADISDYATVEQLRQAINFVANGHPQ